MSITPPIFKDTRSHLIKISSPGKYIINADQAVQALGFDGSFEDYLGTDEGLDMINRWKKEHPGIPFFGNAVIKTVPTKR